MVAHTLQLDGVTNDRGTFLAEPCILSSNSIHKAWVVLELFSTRLVTFPDTSSIALEWAGIGSIPFNYGFTHGEFLAIGH
jgi:hypothetical protein